MITEGRRPTAAEQREIDEIEGELFRALKVESGASRAGVISVLDALAARRDSRV